MIKNAVILLFVLTLAGVSGCATSSPKPATIKPAEVREITGRVAEWQLTHPSRHRKGDWSIAPFHNGLVALGQAMQEPRFLEAARQFSRELNWTPITTKCEANDHAAMQTYLELYLLDRDPVMLAPNRARLDAAMAVTATLDDELTFAPKNFAKWSWCDALYMSPPAYVMAARATGDAKYLAYVDQWWWKLSAFLYDPAEHLYFRDQTFFAKREPNGQKVFWSRGNGWVFAGLARVLAYLPADHPTRPRYEAQFKAMAARLVQLQPPDGFWHASLLDPVAFPNPETSGTGFFVYGLAWGVNQEILSGKKYRQAAERGWQALVSAVQPDGKLGWVQRIGDGPVNTSQDSSEPYGVGAFLLAGSEVVRLAEGRK